MRFHSQPQHEVFRHVGAIKAEPCNSPSFQSPVYRPFAWQSAEGDAEQRTARFTYSLLLQPERWQATSHGSTAVRLHGRPERHQVLQTSVSIERHLSRISPVFPSVTRIGACPAPVGTSMFCFGLPPQQVKAHLPGPRFCAALRVWVSKQKISLRNMRAAAALRARFSLRSLRRKHISALGAGHLASLRARVSRGQSGQIQTGEKQWQPTETTSL